MAFLPPEESVKAHKWQAVGNMSVTSNVFIVNVASLSLSLLIYETEQSLSLLHNATLS